MHRIMFKLFIKGRVVHLKLEIVTQHYQRCLSSQYLLQMEVQVQQKVLKLPLNNDDFMFTQNFLTI